MADDHDVDRGLGALGVGRIDDELAVHPAHTRGSYGGTEGNVGQSHGAGSGVDGHHIRIIFLVGGEDQCDHLGLIAKAVGEQRADGAIDLTRCQNLLLAGPTFALDEAAGDASACIGVLTIIDREWEKIDAFPRVRRGNRGGQHHGLTRRYQRSAGSLLGHASGLKNQPFAASQLDSYFMLRRHRVLVSFYSLGKLVWGDAPWGAVQPDRRTGNAGLLQRLRQEAALARETFAERGVHSR